MKAQEKATRPDVAYFSCLEEAERHMAETAGCEVRQCVYPTVGNLTYYISLSADVFGVRHLKQGKHTRMWSVTKNKTCPYYKKRVYYRLSKGHHFGTRGHDLDIRADVLMYCTYTLGRWDSDVEVDFKDGNVHNLHPSNLMRHISQPPPEHTERVSRFSDIYRRYYDEVVRIIGCVGGIPVEDARDIASQQYLLLTTVAFYTGFSKELWIHMCKLAVGNHRKRYTNRLVRGEIMDDLRDFDINGEHAETDLLAPLNDRERLVVSMWAHGHRICDIVEELGIKQGTVSMMIIRALRKLRKHFRRDIEIYRKEN